MNGMIRAILIAHAILLSGFAAGTPAPKTNIGDGATKATLAQDAAETDRLPVLLKSVYPDLDNWNTEALRRYERIITVIEATIDESGTQQDVRVVESEDDEIAKAVADVFRSWRFSPALRDGRAVRQKIVIPLGMESGKSALIAPCLPRQL